MKTIRWGIIGCGNVTEVKSGPGFQKADNSALVAVMRRNGALAADYAERHGIFKWYDDADQLIQDSEVDAIYVATPPAQHKEYVLKCAKAGKPVYVEKPMALNYEECVQMMKSCEEAGVPLFVAFYRRALPRFIQIKELIDSGAIGDVRFVTMKQSKQSNMKSDNEVLPWRLDKAISGGGLFVDLASHTLDIMDFLLGPIKAATGNAGNQAWLYSVEDIVTGSFLFESGIQGTGVWCFTAFENVDINEIVGSKGKLTFSTFGDEPVVLMTDEGITEFESKRPQHIQQHLIQTMVNELNGGAASPSHGESAARTSWVMDQLLQGYTPSGRV